MLKISLLIQIFRIVFVLYNFGNLSYGKTANNFWEMSWWLDDVCLQTNYLKYVQVWPENVLRIAQFLPSTRRLESKIWDAHLILLVQAKPDKNVPI